MNNALVDTDVLIDHLRGQPRTRDFLTTCFEQHRTTFISVISISEIRAGMRPEETDETLSFLNLFRPVPVTPSVAARAGDYRNQFGDSHGVLLPDAIIAATAYENNATLFTHNTRHFPMEQVSVEDPFS